MQSLRSTPALEAAVAQRCACSPDAAARHIARFFLAAGRAAIQSVSVRERLLQLVRFSAVGLFCLGVGLAVLYGLDEFAHVYYLIAYVASFVIPNLVGYVLNARFTFLGSSIHRGGAARYMMVNAVLLLANTAAMKLLVSDCHMWYMSAAILLAAVNTPLTFLCQRLITYRIPRNRVANTQGV